MKDSLLHQKTLKTNALFVFFRLVMVLLLFQTTESYAQATCDLGTKLSDCVGPDCPALNTYPNATYTPININRGKDAAFSVLVGGNFTIGGQNVPAEIEGRMAIKGNLILGNGTTPYNNYYGIGTSGGGTYVVSPANVPGLIIGGVIQGSTTSFGVGGTGVLLGGAYNNNLPNFISVDANNGNTPAGLGVDIDACLDEIEAKSQYWSTLTATGNASGSVLTGNGVSMVQVFNVNTWQPFSFSGIPAGASVIVNVSGTTLTGVSTAVINAVPANGTPSLFNVLYNFYQATSVTFSGSGGFYGSAIIPNGNADMLISNFDGRLVVGGNLTHNASGGEIHNYPYVGELPCPPTCVKPKAIANKKVICEGQPVGQFSATIVGTQTAIQWYGPLTDTITTFSNKLIASATAVNFTPAANQLPAVGTTGYYAVVVQNGGVSCADTAFAYLTINAKPTIAVVPNSIKCAPNLSTYSLKFTTIGGTVVASAGTLAADSVFNIPKANSVKLVITSAAGCKDSITVTPPTCDCPTIPVPTGSSKTICQGQTIPVLTVTAGVGLQANWYTAATGGSLLASNTLTYLPAGAETVYVEAVDPITNCKSATRLAISLIINPKPTVTTANVKCFVNLTTYSLKFTATGGTVTASAGTLAADSIFNIPIASSVKLLITSAAGCKDSITVTPPNCVVPCVKPTFTLISAPVCANDKQSYSFSFTVAPKNGIIKVSSGTLTGSGNGPYTVTNILPSFSIKITDSLSANCKYDTTIVAPPSCNCTPQVPTALGSGAVVCQGSLFPVLQVTVTNGVTADWYTTPTGGNALATGTLSYQPAGNANGSTIFYAEARGTTLQCGGVSATRTPITVTVNPKPVIVAQTPKCASNGTTYSVKFTRTPNSGVTITTTAGVVAGDSVYNIPAGTAIYLKVLVNATGCKDSVQVTAPTCQICIKPTFAVTPSPTCAVDDQTYSVQFSLTGKNGTIKVSIGSLSGNGNGPYTVSNIPTGTTLKITDSLSAACKFDTLVVSPVCDCVPDLPLVLNPNVSVCQGDTFPTLKVTVVGLVTVDWFDAPTGGNQLATGTLSYKPSGVATVADTIYVRTRSIDPTCSGQVSVTRTPIFINVQNCTVLVDLHLKKLIDRKLRQVGDTVIYTVKVWNESANPATGVEVSDVLNLGVTYISSTATRGSYNSATAKWTIGNIAANGDTVTLTIKVKVKSQGIWFNTAEICKINEKDVDSNPCNEIPEEDDIDYQCFTVPIKLCPTEKVEISAPATNQGVVWYRTSNGTTTQAGTGAVILVQDVGSYTFTATNGNCPAEGCCPVIIEPGDNCCPTEICIPLTIKKLKK